MEVQIRLQGLCLNDSSPADLKPFGLLVVPCDCWCHPLKPPLQRDFFAYCASCKRCISSFLAAPVSTTARQPPKLHLPVASARSLPKFRLGCTFLQQRERRGRHSELSMPGLLEIFQNLFLHLWHSESWFKAYVLSASRALWCGKADANMVSSNGHSALLPPSRRSSVG